MKKQFLKKLSTNNGSTIIELLISLMIVGLIVTAVASMGTYTIKSTGEARFRQIATSLGQEVIEKSRAEKTRLGFIRFDAAVNPDSIYCLVDIPVDFEVNLPAGGVCNPTDVITVSGVSTDFLRQVNFTNGGSGEIVLEITVSWQDGTNTRDIKLTQVFRKIDTSF